MNNQSVVNIRTYLWTWCGGHGALFPDDRYNAPSKWILRSEDLFRSAAIYAEAIYELIKRKWLGEQFRSPFL